MPDEKYLLQVILNPLRFFAAEFVLPGKPDVPDEKEVLRYLTDPSVDGAAESFVKRYKDLMSALDSIIIASPADELFLDKFIRPIQHAIRSYLLGGYLGCISMCGMVSEMSAILIYQMADKSIGNQSFTSESERHIYGREYEKLGQERRIDVLKAFGFIDLSTFESFDKIRQLRNRYLHYLSQDHSGIETDAKECLISATRILHFLMKPSVSSGGIAFSPVLVRYLIDHKIMKEKSPNAS